MMPEEAGVQCDSAEMQVEQERLTLEEELRLNRTRLIQVEQRLDALRDGLPPPTRLRTVSEEETRPWSDHNFNPASRPITLEDVLSPSSSVEVLSPASPPSPAKKSDSKKRRERKKRVRDRHRVARDPRGAQPSSLGPPTSRPLVKNELGIISIRRKDCGLMTKQDVEYVRGELNLYCPEDELNLTHNNMSIFKNYVRVFSDSKEKMANLWMELGCFRQPWTGHCGYSWALPGTKFSDVRTIECRVPKTYEKHSKEQVLKSFLKGCPKFDERHVKCSKTPLLLKNGVGDPKCVVLFVDATECVIEHLRANMFMSRLDKRWKVKWKFSKRDTKHRNKVYKRVEDSGDYWKRKMFVSLKPVRATVNPCYDFRSTSCSLAGSL